MSDRAVVLYPKRAEEASTSKLRKTAGEKSNRQVGRTITSPDLVEIDESVSLEIVEDVFYGLLDC